MNEIKTRQQFTREFKIETVEFLLRGDETVMKVSRDLCIRTE
ncbi:MAG: transposase [Candidatus Marinimicrobia bacterium]|nr:transposase [Candidatus Neomarinimicrobiota bacterium]